MQEKIVFTIEQSRAAIRYRASPTISLASAPERHRAPAPSLWSAAMCVQCDQINITIARYRRLSASVNDHLTHDAAERLVATLEAEKQALHPPKER